MRGDIRVTDRDWFEFLAGQPALDEVNFWLPSDTRTPQQLVAGMPVIFKLRERYGGWIVGWGIFVRHQRLHAWLAWDAFGTSNGAPDFAALRERIERLRPSRDEAPPGIPDYEIGCLMLSGPVFLPRERWVRPPRDWPANVVQGKAYDLDAGEGARVWSECLAAAAGIPSFEETVREAEARGDRYGSPTLRRPRLGQGLFRVEVTAAYGRACAVTQEHSLPALEAAHIRPYGEGGAHEVTNGLLLRSDIHHLFDKGYVGVTPDYRFVVSDRLRGDFANGRSYYPLHRTTIHVPDLVADKPNRDWLAWHMGERFRR